MTHRSVTVIADGFALLGVTTLRYQFHSIKRGSKRVGSRQWLKLLCVALWPKLRRRAGSLPLFAYGRFLGGFVTSQAQETEPLADLRGLIFFVFPLHPAGKPSAMPSDHLQHTKITMLFLQGTRDSLADVALLRKTVDRLASRATLHLIDSADHAFHVPARAGRKDDEVLTNLISPIVGTTFPPCRACSTCATSQRPKPLPERYSRNVLPSC